MNSPKLATQVKFHNWTLQERGRVELFLFSPIIFFFSWHFKKGVQQLGGRVFGGEGRHLCTWPELCFESTQKCRMRQENWDFSDLWKIEQNLFVFPQLIHRRSCTLESNHVKNCKKTSNYMLYQVGRSKLKIYFCRITYVKISCKFICTFLAQNSP